MSTPLYIYHIRNAEAALLKFGNIQAGIFERGIKLSADLAAFMGTDVADAAQTIGKALSSPTEGVGALERQIGKLSKTQEENIKKFVETGNVLPSHSVAASWVSWVRLGQRRFSLSSVAQMEN